jgi:hypothetical protein
MRYYMHDGPAAFRFELAGDLDAADAARLEQDWHTASSMMGNRTLIIDVSFVTGIDETVRSLFRRWYAAGAEFSASSKRSRELVESITERPFTQELPHAQTYRPWFSFKSHALFKSALLGLLALVPVRARAEGPSIISPAPTESLAFGRYIASIQERDPFTESGPVIVEIEASLPGLYKQSRVLAIRLTGQSERSEYQVLLVDGDATVTQEVIARYLAAQEQVEALPASSVEITPANYKFRYMGAVGTGATSAYVYRITPRKNRAGLLQGQLWIDLTTGVAVLESGHFVKTPPPFVGRIEMVRDTTLLNGSPSVRITHVTLETKTLGRGELTITECRLTAEGESPSKPTGASGGSLTAKDAWKRPMRLSWTRTSSASQSSPDPRQRSLSRE